MKKIIITILFSLYLFVPDTSQGATFYTSFDGTCAGTDGLATTTAWCNLNNFTEVARAAGDLLVVDRGQSTTTAAVDLTFTSDGVENNPISISADNDNLWNRNATSTQTFSVTQASTTMVASAAITGINGNEWIYVAGDCFETYNSTTFNQCEHYYRVRSVVGTILELYHPYKGSQSGAGNALRILPANPIWGTTGVNNNINWLVDDFWRVKGMEFRSGDTSGILVIGQSYGTELDDLILFSNNNGAETLAFTAQNPPAYVIIKKGYFINTSTSGTSILFGNASGGTVRMYDTINSAWNGINTDSNTAIEEFYMEDSILSDCSTICINFIRTATNRYRFRNVVASTTVTTLWDPGIQSNEHGIYWEDYDGNPGQNYQFLAYESSFSSSSLPTIYSTSTLRAGGGPTTMQVEPSTDLSTNWELGKMKLFDFPIYADTTSKTYSMFFRDATTTAQFSADPTASEFWIECSYWGSASTTQNWRVTKKSTGVIDFNGSFTWQSLAVTCQPSLAGTLYLRGWYAKTKETSFSNSFLMDLTPTVQ